MQRATIDDVAKAAGVSTFTVSRALRGKAHVAAATREKVLAAAAKLNYTASRSAADLASGRTKRIALLSRERISGWFHGALLEGLIDVLAPSGYDLTVYRIGNAEERTRFFTDLPTNRNADALIIAGFALNEEEKRALMGMAMPIVSVNASDLTYCQVSIAIDDESSEAQIVRYLAALGHRRFCFLGRADPISGDDWGFDAPPPRLSGRNRRTGTARLRHVLHQCQRPECHRQTVASLVSMPDRPNRHLHLGGSAGAARHPRSGGDGPARARGYLRIRVRRLRTWPPRSI